MDLELFYLRNEITADKPPTLMCLLCYKKVVTKSDFEKHFIAKHSTYDENVFRSICASVPSKESDRVTNDFLTNKALCHNDSDCDSLDEPTRGSDFQQFHVAPVSGLKYRLLQVKPMRRGDIQFQQLLPVKNDSTKISGDLFASMPPSAATFSDLLFSPVGAEEVTASENHD